MKKQFEFVDHMADIKIKVYGATIPKIFQNVTKALSTYISSNAPVKARKVIKIKLTQRDLPSLLYAYLEELLYYIEVHNFIAASVAITLKDCSLVATLKGDTASNYELQQVKAPTYAEMYVKKARVGWVAQVVLDV